MIAKIKETADFIKNYMKNCPRIAIVLGSGLGNIVNYVNIEKEIPYSEIPNFPISTVKGHKGSLILGKLNGVDVIIQNGRFHYYEGYDMRTVTFPIRVFKALGVEIVILSNAAGGMNPSFKIGDMMLIRDHINLFGTNPLLGQNFDELGPRFLDMSEAYSKRIRQIAFETAKKLKFHVQEGVYVGVTGPCFETPSEYRMYHAIGGDAVGMSTVPETIVARHSGMEVFALSIITDLGIVGVVERASHDEVLKAANDASPNVVQLVYEMIPQL